MKAAKVTVAIAVAAGLAISASALTITPGSLAQVKTGPETSQSVISGILAAYFASQGCEGMYLAYYASPENGESENAPFDDDYETTFVPPTESEHASIVWDGPDAIDSDCEYLLVKDGVKGNPAWYLFDLNLADWNGTDTLDLQNFWLDKGSISHVSIYSGAPSSGGGGGDVPDGGAAVMLLGLAVAALGGVKRLIG